MRDGNVEQTTAYFSFPVSKYAGNPSFHSREDLYFLEFGLVELPLYENETGGRVVPNATPINSVILRIVIERARRQCRSCLLGRRPI
jgi:hypothetical protein